MSESLGVNQSGTDRTAERFRTADTATGSLRGALEDDLILGHLDIAETAARTYCRAGRELDDLRQVARLGLIKAARGFDPQRGNSFAAYAMPTVVGELKRYLRDSGWVIKPPRELQDLRTRVAKTQFLLAQQLGREPELAELAGALGRDPRTVAEALNCLNSLRPESLDAPLEGRMLADTLVDPGNAVARAEERIMLRTAMLELTGAEQQLLFHRYYQEQTQQEIGDRMGLTQMQVSRMLSRVLVRLQRRLLETQDPPSGRYDAEYAPAGRSAPVRWARQP